MEGQMNDPLGAVDQLVDINRLVKWNDTESPEYDIIIDNPLHRRISPFKCDQHINSKIILWSGDPTALNTEAIVNSTNEQLHDRNPLSEKILNKAGPDLKREVRNYVRMSGAKACRTGEAKITKGYKLPCRYVIHTVGPRYNIRYRTAAESALYNSYRSVMELVKDNNISTLGLSCIHSRRRSYPSYEGAHIAIRTVRRFLEKFGDNIDSVVFVVHGEDEDVYISLLPLYFPRTQSEEDFSAYHLPDDVGNEDGEPVIAERQIRIMGKPTIEAAKCTQLSEDFETSVSINDVFQTSVAVGAHSFAKMEADVDKKRKQKLIGSTLQQLERTEQFKRYERWVRRARQADLTALQSLRCFYHSGFDKYGRPVVVFVGKNYSSETVPSEKALLHFVNVMDSVVDKQFVVVYLHTLSTADNQPETQFLKDIYAIVDHRYFQNLGALYILHSTFWSRLMTWLFTTFNASDIKSKVHHLPGLEYLYSRVTPDQLDLPDFVIEHDVRINGTRYYNPEEDEAIGAL